MSTPGLIACGLAALFLSLIAKSSIAEMMTLYFVLYLAFRKEKST